MVCWREATDIAQYSNPASWNLLQERIPSQQRCNETGPGASCTAQISGEAQTEFKMFSH